MRIGENPPLPRCVTAFCPFFLKCYSIWMRAEFGCAGNNLSRRLWFFWGAPPTATVAPGETHEAAAVVLFWWTRGAPLQWMKA